VFSHQTHRQDRGARRQARRGFTLAEIMVAIAVFAVVAAIAMTLYQQLQKNFKQGENAVAQQQNTRIAFDRLIADLRMAGFNYNPDGSIVRPDEQIEGMWQNAVTIRGDYDRETSDASTPESSLGGPTATFHVVSTGNDEIVTYALGKPTGGGGTSIQFQADVTAVPRDGTVDTVTINNVYMDMNSPPYTLYRIVLKPGGTALSNMPDKQPLADNIKSMTFTYYDALGNVLGTMAGGMDTAADIAARKKIAKVGIQIVGMTQDPDRDYADPTDTNPLSRNYRKFDLASDVVPRNLGFVGAPDLDVDDPNTPTGLYVDAGHCGGLYAGWLPNDPAEGVIKYEVTSGPTVTSQSGAQDVFGTTVYINGLNTTGSYVVAVAAVDGVGNYSDPRAYSSPTTMSNTGLNPTNGSLENKIEIPWNRPPYNDPNSGVLAHDRDPNNMTPLRDLAGYRLYRGGTVNFDPGIPAQVQVSWDPNTLRGNDPDPNMTDPAVVNCRNYYYRVLAEDLCGVKSSLVPIASSAAILGLASTTVLPATPVVTKAEDLGQNISLITWNPVTQNVSSAPVLIDKYKIWRAAVTNGDDPNLASYSMVYDGTPTSITTPSYTDGNVPNIAGTETYWYRVSAHDDCPNESAQSLPAELVRCSFGGMVQTSITPGGNPIAGPQTIVVTATTGVTPASGSVTIRDTSNGAVVYFQSSTTYPYTFAWNAVIPNITVGHTYDIVGTVTNSAGCTESSTSTVTATSVATCCIAAANPRVTNNTTLGTVGGGVKNNELIFDIYNSCGSDITIERWNTDWTNKLFNAPQLTAWVYGSTTPVILSPPVNPASGPSPNAIFDLRVPPFTPYDLLLTNGSLNPVAIQMIFTKAMAAQPAGVPTGNLMSTEFEFRVKSNGSFGSCTIQVIADTSTPGIILCDPVVDPNCPGF
jgi:prepilin-type N-terminal cleavage/methylation domain-containing protein